MTLVCGAILESAGLYTMQLRVLCYEDRPFPFAGKARFSAVACIVHAELEGFPSCLPS